MNKTRCFLIFISLSLYLTAQSIYGISHMRVIWQENPSHESFIAWTTKGVIPKKNNLVYYDTVRRKGSLSKYRYQQKAYVQKRYTYGASILHGVKLKKLKPYRKYWFVIRSGKKVSKEFYFITAPNNNKSFALIFGGDSRTYRNKRIQMNRLMSQIFKRDPKIMALVHGGDFVANGASWGQWKGWLEDWQILNQKDGRVLPIIATRGNHEISKRLFNDIFLSPGSEELPNIYKTKMGKLSLLNLNTNWVIGGPQKQWLRSQLKKERKKSRWIIPNYHEPAWPAVKKPGAAQKHWVPLFEKYQVDIVFESDGHVLKRTAPIYKNQINHRKGITYVGEGGLGVKQREPRRASEWYFNSPGYAISSHHMMKLTITPKKMIYRVITEDYKVFDRLTLRPRRR